MNKITKATLRWITNPLDRSNIFLLKKLNGVENESNLFTTPYIVETPGEDPITVFKKYIFDKGDIFEYYYEIEGPSPKVQELCSMVRRVAYSPLELTYVISGSEEILPSKDLYGILSIIKVLVEKELLGDSVNPFSDINIEKVIYNYFKNPSYITFTPVQKTILPTAYSILDEYRAKLPNPLGDISKKFYFSPTDKGCEIVSPIYVNEKRLADIRSKINIGDLIGWTLLHPTPMPYHILDEWCNSHDYLRKNVISLMKRVGSEKDIVVIKNDLVYSDPESIFWDLRSKSIIKEDRGWFIYKIPEVSLSENIEKIYEEIFQNFGFQKRTIEEFPQEMCLHFDSKCRCAFGFDVKEWLEQTKTNIFNDLPPILRIEGKWINNDNLPLTSENLARVTYAAYRAYTELIQKSRDYLQFTDMLIALPDFSVSLPVYNLNDYRIVKNTIISILETPQDIKAIVCKDLSECVLLKDQTYQENNESMPLIIDINDNPILASFSTISSKPTLNKSYKSIKYTQIEELDILDPQIQGFIDFDDIKGLIDINRIEEFKLPKPKVNLIENKNNIIINVSVDDDNHNYDLITIYNLGKGNKEKYKKEIEKMVSKLWINGYFLTNWARSLYLTSEKLSSYLIRDVQSEIKTFDDLKIIYKNY